MKRNIYRVKYFILNKIMEIIKWKFNVYYYKKSFRKKRNVFVKVVYYFFIIKNVLNFLENVDYMCCWYFVKLVDIFISWIISE